MREIDETIAYIVREECNAALRWQARAAEARVALARLDGRYADASTHQTRANRLLGLIEPHDPVSLPPIPAAARKPKVGEVWVFKGSGDEHFTRLVIKDRGDTVCAVSGNGHFKVWSVRDIIRPATPEEAEPFRELMNGLMLALGEVPAIDPSKDITGKNLRDMMRDPRYWPDRDPDFINKVVGSFAELYPDNGND